VREETGLSGTLLTFRTHSTYFFYRKGKVKKTVEFGILLSDGEPKLSSEHLDLVWVDSEKALSLLKFDEHKRVFSEALNELSASNLL